MPPMGAAAEMQWGGVWSAPLATRLICITAHCHRECKGYCNDQETREVAVQQLLNSLQDLVCIGGIGTYLLEGKTILLI